MRLVSCASIILILIMPDGRRYTCVWMSRADRVVPFLPVREDFHPKRNQARQKLATLPKNRFKDLASDVYFELKRRYPEFEQDEVCILQ